jgi:hypothetical protein
MYLCALQYNLCFVRSGYFQPRGHSSYSKYTPSLKASTSNYLVMIVSEIPKPHPVCILLRYECRSCSYASLLPSQGPLVTIYSNMYGSFSAFIDQFIDAGRRNRKSSPIMIKYICLHCVNFDSPTVHDQHTGKVFC